MPEVLEKAGGATPWRHAEPPAKRARMMPDPGQAVKEAQRRAPRFRPRPARAVFWRARGDGSTMPAARGGPGNDFPERPMTDRQTMLASLALFDRPEGERLRDFLPPDADVDVLVQELFAPVDRTGARRPDTT
jgi:hypothetical protein